MNKFTHESGTLYGCARCGKYVVKSQITIAPENPAAMICRECAKKGQCNGC